MRCRSIAESLLQDPPAEGLPASADDLKTIAVAATAFNEVIANVKAIERSRTAKKLNNKGQPLKQYQVGDRVAFYMPPNDKEAARMGKKPKHMLQYKGPAEITEALSNNNTAFKLKCGNRTYRRNIMHISPYNSDKEVAPQLQLHIDTTVSVGTYVAVIDTTGDTRYHLAQVIDIGEDQTLVHYHATRGKKLRGATWRPIYKHPNTNRYVMEEPETINRADTRFTGTFPTRPTEDSLIILANVGMTGTMKIDARSRNILKKMNKYRHHIIQQTWNP